ncbi:CoA-transferase subunit beta [Fertoebacter nigrum]|uniref:CoA-transferase subunit beta n=1 Tax=Fertoeibacter niger TaxID=2656921 RepID=A0A8X8H2C8_9RHOB|nr:CoA-transferase [Fertoeibacter niger]NUB45014.1 CoA-transferase subunit beta [Fertoeibacter niger]
MQPDPATLAMAWHAAQDLADGEVAFVGIGAPGLAAMIARRLHAPGITMIFESGVIGADPDKPPLSTGSPSVARGAAMLGSMMDVFAALQKGIIDVGLLSGAEVDRFGNLNSTVIGHYDRPTVRLPGSGGAHDIAVLARRTVLLMPHEPKRFVQRVSYVTSPGHPGVGPRRPGPGRGAGPAALATPRALFRFDDGEMTLAAVAPGFTADQAVEGIPWVVRRRQTLASLPPLPALDGPAFHFMHKGGAE